MWIAGDSADIGGPVVVSAGNVHDLRICPAIVAYDGDLQAGFAVYRVEGPFMEILGIKAAVRQQGVGSALLDHLETLARDQRCQALRLCTTNDNLDALRFYLRRGFVVFRWHVGGFEEVRRLKGYTDPFPQAGLYGIPVRDIVELQRDIGA